MKSSKKTSSKPSAHQVRIIGGTHRRRQLSFVDADGLRPTPDRLRETIFNWLMSDTLDARVLDVCAGSGVLGFESLSRGARHATLIEPNPSQVKALHQNADNLRLDPNTYTIINATAQSALPTLHTPFDIIFIDPPYAMQLWRSLLMLIKQHSLAHQSTLIYLESDRPLELIVAHTDPLKNTKVGQVNGGLYDISILDGLDVMDDYDF